MKQTNKSYPIHQSPLYKILGKNKLASILNISLEQLPKLLNKKNYRVWNNKKGREIQEPIGRLKEIHQRIASYLKKIELPNYVFSKKGRSYIDNAKQHVGSNPLGKTDITKFYPSTTKKMVFEMFTDYFQCAKDIASILSDLCCYNQSHLPTGSSLSGLCAFFSSKKMFDEINELSLKQNSYFTLYVDDITISGISITRKFMAQIQMIIRRHGHKTQNKKTKIFPKDAVKIVTGVIISGDKLKLPNSRHYKAYKLRAQLKTANEEDPAILKRSLNGRLEEARQINLRNNIYNIH